LFVSSHDFKNPRITLDNHYQNGTLL